MGEYSDLIKTKDGKLIPKLVSDDTEGLLEELSLSINHLRKNCEYWKEEYNKAKSETYKDDELQRLKKELDDLKKERYYGFEISKEENSKINAWMKDWFKKHSVGNHYMGAIGGGFTYEFHPTWIGTAGVVIAPDGERFEFREID